MSWTLQTCALLQVHQVAHFKCAHFVYAEPQFKKINANSFLKGPVNKPPYLTTNNLFSWNLCSNSIPQCLHMSVQFGDYKALQELTCVIFSWEPSPMRYTCRDVLQGIIFHTPRPVGRNSCEARGTCLEIEIWGYHPQHLSFHDAAEPRRWSFKKARKVFWVETTSVWKINLHDVQNNWYLGCFGWETGLSNWKIIASSVASFQSPNLLEMPV